MKDQENILTWEGYIAKFYAFTSEGMKHVEAYEATEKLLKARYGVTRYANYESFKSEKSRRAKLSAV